jgi:K+-transporting ATPase A subunit
VLLLSRFLPIIGPLVVRIVNKKYIPESAGHFKTDTTILSYGFAVIAIAALSFFPALLWTNNILH